MYKKCLPVLFHYLSKIGLRQKIVSLVAFNPPTVSYVLRMAAIQDENAQDDNIQNSTSCENSQFSQIEFESSKPRIVQSLVPNNRSNQLSRNLLEFQKTEFRLQGSLSLTSRLRSDTKTRNQVKLIKGKPSLLREGRKTMRNIKNYNYQCQQQDKLNQKNPYYQPKNLKTYPKYVFQLITVDNQIIDIEPTDNLKITSYILKNRQENYIASIFVENKHKKSDYVILFSHGNSTDLGFMLDTYLDLASNLNINVFSYDYSGYGQSTGHPNDINTIYDIETAYLFLTDELSFNPTNIIIYGYSIGSGPTIALAASPKCIVGGLIVHSGLASGMRVLNPKIQSSYYDFFPNKDLIQTIQCPILILHGLEDEEIPYINSELLAENAVYIKDFWKVENGGHCNIDTNPQSRSLYFHKIKQFIHGIFAHFQILIDVMLDNKSFQQEILFARNRPAMNMYLGYYQQIIRTLLPQFQINIEEQQLRQDSQVYYSAYFSGKDQNTLESFMLNEYQSRKRESDTFKKYEDNMVNLTN